MRLVYFNNYSLVYPEVFKTIYQNYKIKEVIFLKKGLNQETTDKKLVLFRKQVELQISLIDPFISVEFQEIPQVQDLKNPKKFESYIESLIQSEYSSLPKNSVIYLIETLEINHMKWALEEISKSWTFILFTNKNKKTLDLSIGGQDWKKIYMVNAETEKSMIGAIKRVYKEQNDSRFDHTLRVVKFANQIADWCSLDKASKDKLLIGCAYHDFAKNWTKEKLLNSAKKIYSKPKNELKTEIWNLHGPVAVDYLSKAFNLDSSILKAIEFHTKPTPDLDIIGRALVIADKLEPAKKEAYEEEKYETLLGQLKRGEIEEVFKYLLENPVKKKRN